VTFFLFLLVVSRIYEPMSFALQNLAAMNSMQVNIDRMNEINESPSQGGETAFAPKGYDIVFAHVGFAYNSGETVLKDVSFTAKQGEVTALIGPSGGGKSTAAKLAARFWDIDRGRITVGGVDVATVDPEKLLTAYSIVFQDVTLFNNTVMENIRIGRKDATDAEVMQAAKEAMCDEFIAKLPQGYQTMIGENGSTLSGGERQRISIARALLKDAPIILLDEATASLDAENETEIQQAISRLVERKTVLIIAHRMRTVENANKIVVLSGGTVAETGTPAELMKQNGAFARMVQLQTESQNWALG
jgi:ATP-binding cassette subfamily B protein